MDSLTVHDNRSQIYSVQICIDSCTTRCLERVDDPSSRAELDHPGQDNCSRNMDHDMCWFDSLTGTGQWGLGIR
jgi:hypothetical protein